MRSVCIVGFAPETRELANSVEPDVEVWGMNINHTFLRRWDRWFQIHPFIWDNKPFYGRNQEHLHWLAACGVPVYMTEPHESIPTAVQYPTKQVLATIHRDYLTSSAAYAIALAIYEEVDRILLYGVHAISEIEYVEQRPCIEWLLGLAQGRGIEVVLPGATTLLRGARYPDVRFTEAQERQDRLNANRDAYVATWSKAQLLLGAFNALEAAGLEKKGGWIRRQYVETVLRLQRDLGKYNESLLLMRKAGGTDTGSTTLPELKIPAKFLTAESVTEAADERDVSAPV